MEVSDPHVAAYRGGSARLRREQGGSMTGLHIYHTHAIFQYATPYHTKMRSIA